MKILIVDDDEIALLVLEEALRKAGYDVVTARNGREALGIALTGMLRDGEISRERANEIARLVLRGNAETLYHFAAAK